jgi:DNA repair exonuclease SbcCD ATPase subunit
MIIHNITIRNFKSLYGEHYFDFDKCNGLIKLSGRIGSGKTSLGSAILYGLYGAIKGENNNQLIAWNTKACEVELNLTSNNKEIHIKRNIHEPLIIEVDGKLLSASSKRNTQSILEEELLDVPKLAVIKMCIISFNQFNSLAAMTPSETKQFLDEIFGFKLFSDYNDEISLEKKTHLNENVKLRAILQENEQQISHLQIKKINQQNELSNSIDITSLTNNRGEYINKGIELKDKLLLLQNEMNFKVSELQTKMTEIATLGKQQKNNYNTFKSGKCPTCGQSIDESHINDYKEKMMYYAEEYKKYEEQKKAVIDEYTPQINDVNKEIANLKTKIGDIDKQITIYKNNLKLINENYDDLIKEVEDKVIKVKEQIDNCDREIGEWNEMTELFGKTLRYNLLETLIPHINKSIQYFINKLDQSYKIKYDQEFKPHIFVEGFEKEINYNNLSTGQRKTLDLAVIFGVLQNIIANVDFNILFLDELFSNMDIEARNTMLTLLKENLFDKKSIFVINHAEMQDDFFNHKIKVVLENKKILKKKDEEVIVKSSKYTQIF